jgi:hypothetical protein
MRGPSSRIHAAASRYCGTAGRTVPSARYGRRLTGLGYLWPWPLTRFGQGQARSDREPLPAPVWLVPARAGVVEYEAQHRAARHSWANLNDLHHCHIFCIQVQTRYPYSWPLRPEAKYRRGLPAPQHAWPGRGRSGRLGVNWCHAAVTGPVRPWFPAVASPCVKTQGCQAERQDRSTEASTTQARSARTRSTQTGGSPGRGTAARRAALAPRRPGSWKASRELPRRRTAQMPRIGLALLALGPHHRARCFRVLFWSRPCSSGCTIGPPLAYHTLCTLCAGRRDRQRMRFARQGGEGCRHFRQPCADVRGHGRH